MDELDDWEGVPAETPLSPKEAIIRRHRREKKELQGKILGMKKNCPKDKKKKKELNDEIAKLETDLDLKHKLELDAFIPKRQNIPISNAPVNGSINQEDFQSNLPTNQSNEINTSNIDSPKNSAPSTPKLSRAQKRREKKNEEEKERNKRIEAETSELVKNSDWKKEDDELCKILKKLELEVFDIPADGHCLYSAVSHQLEISGNEIVPVKNLREKTSEYLIEHKDEFINYFDEAISESPEKFNKYCSDIKETATWGGQIEVQILSKVLQRPIRLIQAQGPPILFGQDFKTPLLTLTYHRHKIQAGEHYNSAVPLMTQNDEFVKDK